MALLAGDDMFLSRDGRISFSDENDSSFSSMDVFGTVVRFTGPSRQTIPRTGGQSLPETACVTAPLRASCDAGGGECCEFGNMRSANLQRSQCVASEQGFVQYVEDVVSLPSWRRSPNI